VSVLLSLTQTLKGPRIMTETSQQPTERKSRSFPLGFEAFLPRVFQGTLTDDAVGSFASPGATLTFNREVAPLPGDGVLVRAGDDYMVRLFSPNADGTFSVHSTNPEHPTLTSSDGVQIIGVVTGVPVCRWSEIDAPAPN
jgi:hypothetical protein